MKKFLLSLTLVGATLFGNAQVILNEIYTWPNKTTGNGSTNEYFELFNTSVSTTPVDLDCYTLISYFINSDGTKGFYVIDFPKKTIASTKYFVGASASPFNIQGTPGINADPGFNWNSSTLEADGGSFKKYTVNSTNTGYNVTTPSPTEKLNIFPDDNEPTVVFLFNAGQIVDGKATYMNGVLAGGFGSSVVPNYITSMPAITGLTNPCTALTSSVYSISVPDLKFAEFVNANDGKDNGFVRFGDGLCGKWDKAAKPADHTPNATNGLGKETTTASGKIEATQNITCDGTKVTFKVKSSTTDDDNAFPVTAELYYDNGTIGTLGVGDILVASQLVSTPSDLITYSFNIPADMPAGQKLLVVYRTRLGCISLVKEPTVVAGTLQTTQKNVCGGLIDFSITATGGAVDFSLPIEVVIYPGVDGQLAADTAGTKIASTIITSFTSGVATGSFNLTTPNSDVIVVYKYANCYATVSPVKASPASGSYNTTQTITCGQELRFTLGTPTGDAATYPTFSSGVKVQIYYEEDGLAGRTAGDIAHYPSPIDVIANTENFATIAEGNRNRAVYIVYTSASGCFTATGIPTVANGILTTSQIRYCGKRVDASVTAASPSTLASLAFPVVATAYYDNNSNNIVDADETIGSQNITEINQVVSFVTSAAGTNVKVNYTTSSCFASTTGVATPATSAQEAADAASKTMEVGGDIFPALNENNKREVTYYIVNNNTSISAYPIRFRIVEDVNEDGIQDAGEPVLDGVIVAAEQPNGTTYTFELQNANSSAIILAESMVGCTSATFKVSNSNAILPVSYKSFTATRNSNSQVTLEWETAMEENNKGFHVQRNVDGTWKNIGFVFTQATGGNSTSALKYSFKDANSNKGISQYRILQVDIDGKGKYSEVRSVRGEVMATRITVFPNPSNTGSFSILFEEGTSLRDVVVSDVSGRAVKQYKGVSNSSLTIDNLGAGFYTVQILNRTTGTTATEKVIIKKR